jgi:hypothetical protein
LVGRELCCCVAVMLFYSYLVAELSLPRLVGVEARSGGVPIAPDCYREAMGCWKRDVGMLFVKVLVWIFFI